MHLLLKNSVHSFDQIHTQKFGVTLVWCSVEMVCWCDTFLVLTHPVGAVWCDQTDVHHTLLYVTKETVSNLPIAQR